MKRNYEELMDEFKKLWNVENITSILDSMGVEYKITPSNIDEYHVTNKEYVTKDFLMKEFNDVMFYFEKSDVKKNDLKSIVSYKSDETTTFYENKNNKLDTNKSLFVA